MKRIGKCREDAQFHNTQRRTIKCMQLASTASPWKWLLNWVASSFSAMSSAKSAKTDNYLSSLSITDFAAVSEVSGKNLRWVLKIDVLFVLVRTFLENAVYRPVTQRFFPLSTESHRWETERHPGVCMCNMKQSWRHLTADSSRQLKDIVLEHQLCHCVMSWTAQQQQQPQPITADSHCTNSFTYLHYVSCRKKLFKRRSRFNLRKFVFGNRVVDYWSGLSDRCLNCSTINDFKSKIKVELACHCGSVG